MRVLIWNVYHGRAVPPAGVNLLDEYTKMLDSVEWDVALLQEVPPWWPRAISKRLGGTHHATARTSRNWMLPLRRLLARFWPDLIKSNGGGSNAILSRRPIVESHTRRLRIWPERRVAQFATLQSGVRVVNFHGSTRVPLARDELARIWQEVDGDPAAQPVIVAGDFNLRRPEFDHTRTVHAASRDVDHVFARGLTPRKVENVDRFVTVKGRKVALSDHDLLVVEFAP